MKVSNFFDLRNGQNNILQIWYVVSPDLLAPTLAWASLKYLPKTILMFILLKAVGIVKLKMSSDHLPPNSLNIYLAKFSTN